MSPAQAEQLLWTDLAPRSFLLVRMILVSTGPENASTVLLYHSPDDEMHSRESDKRLERGIKAQSARSCRAGNTMFVWGPGV